MEKVTMDFSFPMTSAEYGRFLVACHNHLPGINISHVETYHVYSPGRAIVSVSVPENIAVLLKLEFGGSIVKRAEPDPGLVKIKIIKNRNSHNKNYSVDIEKVLILLKTL